MREEIRKSDGKGRRTRLKCANYPGNFLVKR
jgi:hypothetical protein